MQFSNCCAKVVTNRRYCETINVKILEEVSGKNMGARCEVCGARSVVG